jgi:hypothetical protein
MSNLAESYSPFTAWDKLIVGARIKISNKSSRAIAENEPGKIGEIVTVTKVRQCKSSYECNGCLCHRKFIEAITVDGEYVSNCCYHKFTNLHGKEISYVKLSDNAS